MAKLSLAEKFWPKVQLSDSCWTWTGAVRKGRLPYGHLSHEGRWLYAHRIAWFLEHGAWPTHEIDHVCRNTLCVNVQHLEDVPRAVNMARQKNRPDPTRCRRQLHDWVPENLTRVNGMLTCRLCINDRQRERAQKKKAAR